MFIEIVGEYTPIEFLEVDVLDSVGEPTTELRIGVRFDVASEPHAVVFSSEVPF